MPLCATKHLSSTFLRPLAVSFALGISSALTPCWGNTPIYKPEQPKQPIRVLCIGGGGVRGIVSARILQAFEEQTGKPIHELFDLVIGTSTGGIISLALTMPNPAQPKKAMFKAEQLVQFYLTNAPHIFRKSIWRVLSSGSGIWGAKYNRKHLDKALQTFFQDSRLAQALCPVGVLSYSLEKQTPYLWSSYIAQQEPSKNHYMRDAAAATSAAPTYFFPKTIVTAQGKESFIDMPKSTAASNPAIVAMTAVTQLYPDFCLDKLILVSLSTRRRHSERKYGFRGIPGLIRLVRAMMNATGKLVDEALQNILPNNYYDFKLTLPKTLMPMDKASEEHLQQLVQHTAQWLDIHQAEIRELLQKLTSEGGAES